jgi:2-polyprenyl-3-methyl-5-hydroxy-6-metoxy-1,4-benzoquinol methylase
VRNSNYSLEMKRLIKKYLGRTKDWMVKTRNRFRSADKIFEEIYRKRMWGNDESVSGAGSTIQHTQGIVHQLPKIFEMYNIKTVLDIPCGDFNWMKTVNLSKIDYKGADIVGDLIAKNNQKYKGGNISFFKADILKDSLPKVDLIICRDCLVHFSDRDVINALHNIHQSNSKFLLTTSFPNRILNPPIVTGHWRPLNLQTDPFHLPVPEEVYFGGNKEVSGAYADKALVLWSINEIHFDR